MTRAEELLAGRWRRVVLPCAIVVLTGIVFMIWFRVNAADSRVSAEVLARQSAVAEANSRGRAVDTLAADVRALRAQVQAAGQSPVAPDPASAVPNLPARTMVVPIPGPSGLPGVAGSPGPAGSPGGPGPSGSPGAPGVGSTGAAGPAGPAGQDGQDGTDGKDGTNGAPPAGWTYTDPAGVTYSCTPVADFDPSTPRYSCSPVAPSSPTPSSTLGQPGILDRRRA